jgi:hypothetical protein
MCVTCVDCSVPVVLKPRDRCGRGAIYSHVCQICQNSFVSNKRRRVTCNSPSCRKEWNRKESAARHRKQTHELCGNPACTNSRTKGRKYCCDECRHVVQYPPKSICQNPLCKKPFRPKYKVANKPWKGKGLYCCDECYADHRFGVDRPRRRSSQKIVNAAARGALVTSLRKKCKLLSVPHDPECTREAVCERDNWVCQMCGIKCDKEHLGKNKKPKPNAAEHDHMIALTTPGSPGNVFPNSQCLCRKCNNRKRTRSWGQVRFDFEESGKRWENGARGRRQRNLKSCEEIPASVV